MKRYQGITLIALIITIIILLILTGVILNYISGQGGILVQTDEAKRAYNVEKAKEQIQLAYMNAKMEINEKDFKTNFSEKLETTITEENGEYTFEYDGYDVSFDKETGEITINDLADKEPEISVNWLVKTLDDGTVELTGIDYTGYDYTINSEENTYYTWNGQTYTPYTETRKWTTITLGEGVLKVPAKIDGKTVTSLNLNDDSVPEDLEGVTITLAQITAISLPNTLTNIEASSFDIFPYNSKTLNFDKGKNADLEIPENKWYANKITIRGIEYGVEYTSENATNGIKWIYETDAEGGAIITGMNITTSDYTKTSNGLYTYAVNVTLGTTTLQIPTKIDGYNVVGLKMSDKIEPYEIGGNSWNPNTVKITDVTQINIPNTVKSIKNTAFNNFNVDSLILNFNDGKNARLEIPEAKWNVNKVIIEGQEYSTTT